MFVSTCVMFHVYCVHAAPPYFVNPGEKTITVNKGEDVVIECAAGGLPAPDLALVYQGTDQSIKLVNNYFVLREINAEDVGNYYCSASNVLVNPPLGKRRFRVHKKITIRLKGECAHIHTQSLVVCTPLTEFYLFFSAVPENKKG